MAERTRTIVRCAAILALLSLRTDAKSIASAPERATVDHDALDPVQWKDAAGEEVYRAKRKFKPEDWAAANGILDLLARLKADSRHQARLAGAFQLSRQLTTVKPPASAMKISTTTPAPASSPVGVGQGRYARADGEERRARNDEDVPQFNPDGTIMLQLPGKLFGNATNFVLTTAKLIGDFITGTAIRTAKFLQLFQPILGRHLFIQIPTTSAQGNAAET